MLQQFPKKSYNAIWRLQDRILPSIRVEAQFNDNSFKIENASFCLLTSEDGRKTLYHITNVAMINENNAELSLLLEPFNTIGIENIKGIDGQAIRLHPLENELLSNVIPEPFVPSEPLQINFEEVKIDLDVTYFIATTMSLDFDLTSPTPMQSKTTEIYNIVWDGGQQYDCSLKGVSLYVYDGDVPAKLLQMHKWGLSDAVVASYAVPNKFINKKVVETSGFVSQIWATGYAHTSKFKAEYTTAKNKKLFNQYNYFTLTSTTSGDTKTFKPWEIFSQWQASGYAVNIFSDISPQGRPYIRTSRYYNENRDDVTWTYGLVNGGGWFNNPITFFKGDGWGWSEQLTNVANTRASIDARYTEDMANASSSFAETQLANTTRGLTKQGIFERGQGHREQNAYENIGHIMGRLTTPSTINKFAQGVQGAFSGAVGGALSGAALGTFSIRHPVAIGGLGIAGGILGGISGGVGGVTDVNMDYSARQQSLILNQLEQESIQNNMMQQQNSRDMSMAQATASTNDALLRSDISIGNAGAILANQQLSNKLNYLMGNVGIAPKLSFPSNTGLSLFTRNTFFLVQTRLSDNDVVRFDKWLSLYGYATNEFMDISRLNNYSHFNYVECNPTTVYVNQNVPNYVTEMLKKVLSIGVTLWHQKPNSNAYQANTRK